MSSIKSEGATEPVDKLSSEEVDVSRISRESHDYSVVIIDHRGPGGAFGVHKEIIRRHSPMMAAWIENRPEFSSFAVHNTTEPAVGMMILYMYSGNLPTLKEVTKAWPEFTPMAGHRQSPVPKGPKFDFLEFMTYVQAYSLATRYAVPQLKTMMEEAAYRFAHQKLMLGSEMGKEVLSAILSNTDPDDQGLRSRVVAFCASINTLLDMSDHGKAVVAVIQLNVPWTWKTCLSTIEIIRSSTVKEQYDLPPAYKSPTPSSKVRKSRVSKHMQPMSRAQKTQVPKGAIELAREAHALVEGQDGNAEPKPNMMPG